MLIKRNGKFFYKLFLLWLMALLLFAFIQEETGLLSFVDLSGFWPQVMYIKKCGGPYLFSGFITIFSILFFATCLYYTCVNGLEVNKKAKPFYNEFNPKKFSLVIGSLTLLITICYLYTFPIVNTCKEDLPPLMALFFSSIVSSNLAMSIAIFLFYTLIAFGFSITILSIKFKSILEDQY